MIVDPITEEIRAIRHALAAQYGNDVKRIFADIREKQASDGRVYIALPKRPAQVPVVAEQPRPEEPFTQPITQAPS